MKNLIVPAAACLLLSGCGRSVDVAEVRGDRDSIAGSPDLVVAPDDWPWWRGPTRNGIAAAGQSVPLQFGPDKNVVWSVPVPGRGHSSPTVIGDAVYLTTADETAETQSVLSFDRGTGSLRWEKTLHEGGFPSSGKMHPKSTHANCTVAGDGERLFVAFLNGDQIHATALSADGEIVWQKVLGGFEARFGYAPSPVLYKSVVILACDNSGGGYLTALDRRTGDVQWTSHRDTVSTYSSPVVARVGGKDQLLISGNRTIASYDPASGEPLWSVAGTAESTCGTAVWDGERVFASGGWPQSDTTCVDANGKRVWNTNAKCYEQSLLAANGQLYAITDRGVAICWDAATGKERWKHRLSGSVSVSPVLIGDHILCANESGTFFVFKADPGQFELVARNRLGSESFATPSVCGDRMFIRVANRENGRRQEYLYCIGTPGSATATEDSP